jgi:protein phosphatase
MGGHAAGEVASRLAVEAIENFVRRSRDPCSFSWPCGVDRDLSYAGNRLRTAIQLANRRVFRDAESHDDYNGMGTTVVCALVTDVGVAIGHVGDSRLYLLSKGRLTLQTRDDTWAASVLAGAELDSRQIAEHPMRNVLTSVLGVREETDIHLAERRLGSGEIVLLCSDGIHSALDDEALHGLLSADAPVEAIARSIVSEAIARGSRDNATAAVVRYLDDSHAD